MKVSSPAFSAIRPPKTEPQLTSIGLSSFAWTIPEMPALSMSKFPGGLGELLSYQQRMNEIQLKVEFMTRALDSGLSVLRRAQQA